MNRIQRIAQKIVAAPMSREEKKKLKEALKDSLKSFAYARDVMKFKDVPDNIVDKISEDAKASYFYAKEGLKGEFKEGEEAIATNPYYSCWYAKNVTKKPFKAGEKAMQTKDVVWKEYLKAFPGDNLKDPEAAYVFAKDVLKFKDVPENVLNKIKEGAVPSYWYAKEVIGGEWKDGEKAIATDAACSYIYADFIQKEFPAGERAMKKDRKVWKAYFALRKTF